MKINNLNDVFEYYTSVKGYLKNWEKNKILDKYNYDKERLFKETQDEVDGLGKTEPLRMTMGGEDLRKPLPEEVEEIMRKITEEGEKEKNQFAEGQIEVIIDMDVNQEDLEEVQDELFMMLDTLNMRDFRTIIQKGSPKHSEDDLPYYMEVTTYTDEKENFTPEQVANWIEEYCLQFFSETEVAIDEGTIFVSILKIHKEDDDKS